VGAGRRRWPRRRLLRRRLRRRRLTSPPSSAIWPHLLCGGAQRFERWLSRCICTTQQTGKYSLATTPRARAGGPVAEGEPGSCSWQAEFFHPQPHSLWVGRPGRRRGEGGAAGARALAGLQARVWHLRPRLHTCCAAGARAVGTRRGDGPSRGLAPKADGATNGG
jgi:hypothetical protein